MSVSTDCASAMASRPHTVTSTSKATVPISLRVRMDMVALCWRHCDAARMTIWSARFPANKHPMHDQRSVPEFRARAVRLWLLAAATMILLTLIIGGATRLTVSGLSIVEWNPVVGVLPPLSEGAWQSEFEKYQEIPQYRKLNQGMSLAQFKVIYLWEWTHRLLARATGAVFLLPFLFFLARAADRAADAGRGAQTAAPRRLGDRRAAARADLSRRAGGRARWRIEIQYLAADRRRDHAAARPAAIHQTALAQSVREYTDGSDQSPHARRCDLVP